MDNQVTGEGSHPTGMKTHLDGRTIIKVQPLKRSEMQVRISFLYCCSIRILNFAFLKSNPMRRTLEQERYVRCCNGGNKSEPDWVLQVTHGVYGSLLNVLGDCVGFCGAFPCVPCPNPYKNVQQGASCLRSCWLLDFSELCLRFGWLGVTLRTVLSGCRPRPG